MSVEFACVAPLCPTRGGSVRGVLANHLLSGTFALAFPELPEGAIPTDIEVQFDDFSTNRPSGYVLHYEVSDPDGDLRCGSEGCPNCGAGGEEP